VGQSAATPGAARRRPKKVDWHGRASYSGGDGRASVLPTGRLHRFYGAKRNPPVTQAGHGSTVTPRGYIRKQPQDAGRACCGGRLTTVPAFFTYCVKLAS
jgi:hypothetical protein